MGTKRARPVSELSLTDQKLARLAQNARLKAYAPYSNFLVGCLLIDGNGKKHTGCNVENASLPAVICAERVAITKMVSRGTRNIEKIVLVTSAADPIFPCGVCLQVILEFGPHAHVISLNAEGTHFKEANVSELLPYHMASVDLFKDAVRERHV